MKRAARALLLACLAVAPAAAEGATEPPIGLWLTGKKGVVVDLFACGEDTLCGRTVWLKKMTYKDGAPRLDKNNPDPALRDRHWCGIQVIRNVKAVSPGVWDGGKVYDPKTGQTFDLEIRSDGGGLKVRGYMGVKFLGRSETWTRAEAGEYDLCTDS